MKVGIFGAGQAGRMISTWLPAEQQLVCYIDNNEEKQGGQMESVPVCSWEEARAQEPELIWVAVLNREAQKTLIQQMRETGYEGEIRTIQDMRKIQDIRLSVLRLAAQEIRTRNIPGEMAELGVYRGAFAAEMNRCLPEKMLYLFDTFEGFAEEDVAIESAYGNCRAKAGAFGDTSVELVKEVLPHPEKAVFCPGRFPESLSKLEGKCKTSMQNQKYALVSLDTDLYEPTYQGLCWFYPALNPGGMLLVHDYNSMQFPGVKAAVERYCKEQGVYVVPIMDIHGSAILIKQG
jgi:O-methyltransferase